MQMHRKTTFSALTWLCKTKALLTSKQQQQQQQHCFSSLGAKVQKMGDNSSSHVTRILFCGPHFPASHNYTREYLQGYPFVQVDDVPLESVPAVIGDYEICVVKNLRMDSDVLSRAKSMKLIMQFGVGLEGVDINAAKKHGIKVARIPGGATGNAASCAEMAIYLILGLLRKQHQLKISVEQKKLGEPIGDNLQGKTVFIMGYGDIGIHLAKRLRPFDVKILATKRSWGRLAQDSSKSEALSVENDSYDDPVDERGNHADILKFASKADIVVCCLAMNNETAGIVNNDFISVMRKVLSSPAPLLIANFALSGHLFPEIPCGGRSLELYYIIFFHGEINAEYKRGGKGAG